MENVIAQQLAKIEEDNNVTILYACESGSRAWGFDNVESDYDVRFIFKRNDLKEYLSISNQDDVIELMDGDLDMVGWDIKKALYLHYRSNPNLREWLISPIRYLDLKTDVFIGLPDFDTSVLKYHYTSIAVNNWKKLSKKDLEITKRVIKMYMYNCRCILTWILLDNGLNPPINIFELLSHFDGEIKKDICYMIDYYKGNCCSDLDFDVLDRINQWMEINLAVMKNTFPKNDDGRDLKLYDDKFFEILSQDFENYIIDKKTF
ncbi:DNA polymerase beta superfamily protein [uncultured Methanobrevibacter sp.]|uniref:nucleotidyltransferase domain-containing protein n=1 Tax=uncultured Methanobrevibacter sp. TaxID=253161 RepID=UPI0025DEAACF|nr:nucleotidyltransferase domain-containing protein [uncultured Methanobrevibacter sp.]MEE3490843.1 nucleotidyltransferase domain-containing protein [Methanobrevibacter sp.]